MARRTRAQLIQLLDSYFPDHPANVIPPSSVRAWLREALTSWLNPADDGLPAVTPGVASYATTTGSPYDSPALAAALEGIQVFAAPITQRDANGQLSAETDLATAATWASAGSYRSLSVNVFRFFQTTPVVLKNTTLLGNGVLIYPQNAGSVFTVQNSYVEDVGISGGTLAIDNSVVAWTGGRQRLFEPVTLALINGAEIVLRDMDATDTGLVVTKTGPNPAAIRLRGNTQWIGVTLPAGVTLLDERTNGRYYVPAAVQTAVVLGTFSTSGATTAEMTSTIPAGSRQGMDFKKGAYIYVFRPGDAGTNTWVRTPLAAGSGPAPSAPTITGASPNSGAVGSTSTLTGTNFATLTAFTLGGTAITTYTVVSATSIIFTVPTGATTGVISLTTAAGTATSTGSFTVTGSAPAPTITNFTPTSGPVGTAVVVTGTSLNGATAATIGGITAGRSNNTATGITLTVLAGGVTGPLAVVTPGGTATSSTSFTLTSSNATISGFTPASQQAGLTIGVAGTNFTSAGVVRISGVQAAYTLNSATSLSVTVPAGITGPGPVSYTENGATATSGTNFTLSYASTNLLANITFVGNSIVQGTLQGGGVGNGFVKYAENLLPGANFTVQNRGVAGWTYGNIQSDVANVQATFNPNPAVKNILFYLEWTNSGRLGISASDYYAILDAYLAARRAEGWLVVPITCLPQDSSTNDDENQRGQVVNGQLRNVPSRYDYLLDASLNNSLGRFTPPAADDVANYPDHTHPSVRTEHILGRMCYDIICHLVYGTAVPNPAAYPPDEVLPGDNVVWDTTYGTVFVEPAPDDNTLSNVAGSPQFPGGALQYLAYPQRAGLVAFAEMTAGTRGYFGFYNLCHNAPVANSLAWIDLGIYTSGVNYVAAWSDGGPVAGSAIPYGAGDRLRIEVYHDPASTDPLGQDTVRFYKNNNLWFTLVKTMQYPLYVSAVMPGGNGGREAGVINCKAAAGQ